MSTTGVTICLVGLQGVGKSSALQFILDVARYIDGMRRKAKQPILFKWRRRAELLENLANDTHEASSGFGSSYTTKLKDIIMRRHPELDQVSFSEVSGYPSIDSVERTMRRADARNLRWTVWLEMLRDTGTILIDTPDYSKTDTRSMAKDLDEMYWLWNYLVSSEARPNIVIAIQKELFQRHFFFDKMEKIELEPLKPEQMIEAYKRRFKATHPFADDALLKLARMSQGIFRRFLRYIILALDHHEHTKTPTPITADQVREAIPPQLLAKEMDQQLSEIFPRQPDLRTQAVKLLLHLEEHGPIGQVKIAELLDIQDYAVSRLLNKLEDHNYIRRERKGVENIITVAT